MSWTIEEALQDDAIERTEIKNDGYSFWLKGIQTEIRVVISVNPARGGFNFRLSHYIHTPTQLDPYHPSRPWGDSQAYALHQAVAAITEYYREAVEKGHQPSDEWLIPDENGI